MTRIYQRLFLGLTISTSAFYLRAGPAEGQTDARKDRVQVILRLAEPPVSAVASPDRLAGARATARPEEIRRERAYCRTLRERQERLTRRLVAMGARVVARYQVAFNGVCVEAPAALLPRFSRLPGVVHVSRVQPVHRNSLNAVSFIGAPTVWSRFDAKGTGVRVAVIDSGIDYTHRDFGGPGTPAAYRANNPALIEPGSFPTAKVVGGYDFVGDDFPSGPPRPDADPLDPAANGHGTRIAGIIAGLGVPGQVGPGVAPGALLLAYKIYGRTGGSTQSIVLQALERAMDPDGDGSVSDHADVINISGGTSRQGPGDPLVLAADNATQLGAIVVGSAGNDGDNPYFVGGPGVAAGAICVGNSYGGGAIFDAVRVNTPPLGNLVAAEGALTAPLTAAGVIADVSYVGAAGLGASLLGSPQGRIALVDRDGRPYADKIRACQAAGALGVVVINNSPSAPTTMTGDRSGINIPGVMISRDDGTRLKAALTEGQRVNVTLSSRLQTTDPEWTDRIDDASSRGPRRGDSLIKPDVVAPGVNVVSAAAGTGDRGMPDTGTSAAAPVVAGIAALLCQIHPGWSVAEIKAAIVNTAQPLLAGVDPYPIARQGAGRVRADAAVGTRSVALADDGTPSLSFGYLDEVDPPIDRRITLINKGNAPRQFAVRVDYQSAADLGAVELAITPPDGPGSRVIVPPGSSIDLDVTLTVHPERLDTSNREYDGFVTLTETGGSGEVLRVPFLATLRSSSAAEISGLSGRALFLMNSSAGVPATARLFTRLIDDPADLGTEGDIRSVGVRTLPGDSPASTRVEFAVVSYQPWSTPLGPQFVLLLDRDNDGRADLSLTNDDAGMLAGSVRTGIAAGALRDLSTGKLLAAGLPLQAEPNSSVMVFSTTAAQLGITHLGRIGLWAQGTDPWRSGSPVDRTAHASFDPLRPDLIASPFDLQFEQSAAVDLQITGDATPGLLVLFPRNRNGSQVQIMTPGDIASIAARR